MYKYGFDLPHFAMFPLLDDPRAVAELRGMYGRYLDTAARHGFGVHRWRPRLPGESRLGLAARLLPRVAGRDAVARHRFPARRRPAVRGQVPALMYAGIVGPRGDAYEVNRDDHRRGGGGVPQRTARHAGSCRRRPGRGDDVQQRARGHRVGPCRGTRRPASVGVVHARQRHPAGWRPVRPLKDAIETIDAQTGDDRPAFYGINCSHPLEFMPAIEPGEWFERVRCLRPNAAMMDKISLCTLGHLEAGDPAALGELMGGLARQHPHIDMWGGCCGTWDTHLEEIARNVRTAREIEAAL